MKYEFARHEITSLLFIFRYATTLVTSKVENPESRSREIFLTVILPETAFISRSEGGFSLDLGSADKDLKAVTP